MPLHLDGGADQLPLHSHVTGDRVMLIEHHVLAAIGEEILKSWELIQLPASQILGFRPVAQPCWTPVWSAGTGSSQCLL